jgi:hypothetical protein
VPHQCWDVNVLGWLLQTSAHGEVLIDLWQLVLAVSLWDDTEELNMIQDMIVEGKVIARDDVDAGLLLDVPVRCSQSLALLKEFFLREFVSPVCFGRFLEITEDALAWKTEDGAGARRQFKLQALRESDLRLNHVCVCPRAV